MEPMNLKALAEAVLLSFKAAEKQGMTYHLEPDMVKRLAQMFRSSLDKNAKLLEENAVMREALRFFADDHSYNALCPVKDKDGKFIAWGESLVHKIGEDKAREALAKADGIRNGDQK